MNDILKWTRDNILIVLVVSLIIPAILSTLNQQSEMVRNLFANDYKSLQSKYMECVNFHSEYLEQMTLNAGSAQTLSEVFLNNGDENRALPEIYFIAFKSTFDNFQQSQVKVQDLRTKATQCYALLYVQYANLAVILGVSEKYNKQMMHNDKTTLNKLNELNRVRSDLDKRTDVKSMFRTLIIGDVKAAQKILEQGSLSDLAMLQLKNIDLEVALRDLQNKNFVNINNIFAEEFEKKLHGGLVHNISALMGL